MIKETREQLIKDFAEFFGKKAIELMQILDLKEHFSSNGIFDGVDDSYEVSFSIKKFKANDLNTSNESGVCCATCKHEENLPLHICCTCFQFSKWEKQT